MAIVYKLFNLFGGMAVFMYGMKLMGDNLERAAGKNMKKMLSKVSNNHLAGVGIGAGVTGIIQNSAATTVMVVGFVNIGVMSLIQAAAIIMGANIGTTVTLQIASFKNVIDIAAIAGILGAAGLFVSMFTKKSLVKRIGIIFVGLGMLFIGLEYMGASVKDFAEPLSHFFLAVNHPLLLIIIGMIFTSIIQSSSVATVMVAGFAAEGAIGLEAALLAVLGMNIGTCVTALLSSIGTNANAKRAAMIHLLFNVIGTLIIIILFYAINFNTIETFLLSISGSDIMRQIANFHTLFNILTTLLLLPFINLLVKLSVLLVKDKSVTSDAFRMYYVDERMLKTPPIAVLLIKKELINMLNLAKKNLDMSIEALMNVNTDKENEILKREEEINYLNKAITKFLVKISALDISYKDEVKVGSYYHVVADIERIGDHAENILSYAKKMQEENITFSEEAKNELKHYAEVLNNLYENTMLVFTESKITYMAMVNKYEDEADNLKHQMVKSHIQRLNAGNCTAENGTIYLSLATNYERVADHLTNIAESVLTY